MFKIYSGIILFIITVILSSCNSQDIVIETPIAQKGILDLRNWDFETNGPVQLNGEWEMYWEKLLTPDDFKENNFDVDLYYSVPQYWNKLKINDKEIDGTGYATFRLKVISNSKQNYELFIDELMTSYQSWWDNKELFKCGKVATNKKESPVTNKNLH